MEIRYDGEADVLVVTFSANKIVESDEEKPGVILDYDGDGGIVSIEILDASEKVTDLEKVDLIFPKGVSVSPMALVKE